MIERRILATVLTPTPLLAPLAAALLVAPTVGQDAARATGRTLLLAERLEDARIGTPLTGLEPARDVSDLKDPALDVLLDEGFEEFDWGFEGWAPSQGAAVGQVAGTQALRLEAPPSTFIGWVLPVRLDAFYRFSRSVLVEGAPFCDLYVVESRAELDQVRLDPRQLFLAGRGTALKVHGLPLDSGQVSPAWQRSSTSFYPTPRTRSLVVLIRRRVGADPSAAIHQMAFDDVLLEEVIPNKRERMRLLKGSHPEPGIAPADETLGMRKAGWLLPLPSPEGSREGEPAESNYDWRRALYAPPTTELAFDLVVPDGARLRLATGLARETPTQARARFQVDLTVAGGEPVRLLDQPRVARMGQWHWEESDLDLAAWVGSEVTLVFRTLAEKGDPHPLWAAPRIETPGAADDPLVILIAGGHAARRPAQLLRLRAPDHARAGPPG